MKWPLYILIVLLTLGSCHKEQSPPMYQSVKAVMDSMGLQFGIFYSYKHYEADSVYEEGLLSFNNDTSFIEIRNKDTFYYHASIIYTFAPNSDIINLPSNTVLSGEAGGIKYTYTPPIFAKANVYPGKVYMAWCCYRQDSVKGFPFHYMPVAYYFENFAPVCIGKYNDSIFIMPPGKKDSSGVVQYPSDRIAIIE